MTRKSVSLLVTLAVTGALMLSVLLPRWMTATTTPNYGPPLGAINQLVTQSNIGTTICLRGWTATIRPPLAYTSNLKRRQIAERHLPGHPSDYEEDHFIPLELGGASRDLSNLWPQPWPQARLKDRAEYGYNRAVCNGRMSLAEAQQQIKDSRNWH